MRGKKRVLFVCVRNSARSQMAEGILRGLYGEDYEAYSAGTDPTALHPLARAAMNEIGMDIGHQGSKGLDDLEHIRFDLAVTVCGPEASCPLISNADAVVRQGFDDPAASPDIDTFRKVRDEIFAWIRDTFGDPARRPTMPGISGRMLEEGPCWKKRS